jgi:hypothetical protein
MTDIDVKTKAGRKAANNKHNNNNKDIDDKNISTFHRYLSIARKSSLYKFFKYLIITTLSLAIILALLIIITYFITNKNLVAENSGEKFIKTRVGTLIVDLPEGVYSSRPKDDHSTIIYPSYHLDLLEQTFSPGANNYIADQCLTPRFDDTHDADDSYRSFSYMDNEAVLYTPIKYYPLRSAYAAKVFFDTGCAIVEGLVFEGDSLDERVAIFKDRVDNLLQYYRWTGDIFTEEKGFKTKFGLISPNNEFKINAHHTFYSKNYDNYDFFISISFANSDQIDEYIEPGFWDMLKYYVVASYFYKNNIKDYRWSHLRRDINFIPSYSSYENISMADNKIGRPSYLRLLAEAQNMTNTGNFSNTISIYFVYGPTLKKSNFNFSACYDNWLKALKSTEFTQ